jgi:hypothetical protein
MAASFGSKQTILGIRGSVEARDWFTPAVSAEGALGPPPEIRECEFRPPLKGEVGLGVYGAVCAGRFGLRVGGSRIRAKCAFRDDEGLSVEHAKAALL